MAQAKMFLGALSSATTKETLDAHFGQYGTVIDSVVMVKDGRPRGFGFVTFESYDSMILALADEHNLDGRVIDAKEAVPQGEAPPPKYGGGCGGFAGGNAFAGAVHGAAHGAAYGFAGAGASPYGAAAYGVADYGGMAAYGCGKGGGGAKASKGPSGGGGGGKGKGDQSNKCFVGGLSPDTTEEELTTHFGQYGTLIDVVVMKDRISQRSKGFGFVQFEDDGSEPVEQVMADYKEHMISGKWVEVKRAVPQGQIGPAQGAFGGFGGGKGFAAKGGCQGGFQGGFQKFQQFGGQGAGMYGAAMGGYRPF